MFLKFLFSEHAVNVQNVSGQFINYFINYKLFDNCFAATAVDALNLHPCLRAVEWYAENCKCMPRWLVYERTSASDCLFV